MQLTATSLVRCEDDTFFDLVPDERDQYFVYGYGTEFSLRQVEFELKTCEYDPTPHKFVPVGLVGITRTGGIATHIAKWARETSPMEPAAAFLYAAEVASQRRAEHASSVAWLEMLFSLPDKRC